MLSKFITNKYVKALTIPAALITLIVFAYNLKVPKKPKLAIQIIQEDSFLNTDIDKTALNYLDLDTLTNSKLLNSIRYKIRVSNEGRENVRKESFDTIGLKLHNQYFIEKPRVCYSGKRDKIELLTIGDSIISIPALIINSKDYFDICFSSIRQNGDQIEISAYGYIENQGAPKFTKQSTDKKSIKPWNESLKTHTIRFSFYLGIAFLLIGFFNIGIWIRDRIRLSISRSKRKKEVIRFKKIENYTYSRSDDPIFTKYIKEGSGRLELFSSKLSAKGKIEFHLEKYNLSKDKITKKYSRQELQNMSDGKRKYIDLMKEMSLDGYVFFEQEELKIDGRLTTMLNEFLQILKNNQHNIK